MLDKKTISDNFSRSAPDYDRHAGLQRQMAAELLSLIPEIKPRKVLDLGCGTGELTCKLAEKYPQAAVLGVDLAPGMIAAAKNRGGARVEFLVGDGEELPGTQEFDLIVSNATLQWLSAEKALARVAALLKPKGVFAFMTFGPQTLIELRTSGFQVNQFLAPDEYRQLAAPLFRRAELTAHNVLLEFKSVKALIAHLKALGANTPAFKKKADLAAFRRFREKHPVVAATFEVVSGLLFK